MSSTPVKEKVLAKIEEFKTMEQYLRASKLMDDLMKLDLLKANFLTLAYRDENARRLIVDASGLYDRAKAKIRQKEFDDAADLIKRMIPLLNRIASKMTF